MLSSKTVMLQAGHLCKTYTTGKEQFHAIRNVDLSIYEGDFTVIMGDSGSGKSTLLYLLSGLDEVTTGEVSLQGQSLDQFSAKELARFRANRIGFIYQNSNLVPDLSLFDNIALPGYIANQDKEQVRQRAHELMVNLSLGKQSSRLPSQVSGGQQQRAAIARALINNPDIIFADEPTGSLNYEQGVTVLDILSRMHADGQSIVMVTHDMKAACRGNRLIYIRDGKIGGTLDMGPYTPEQASEREAMIFAYVTGRR
ncbi:Lipoprotein-releasing system ATP-binding protein LolD [Paenibacillus sp. GM2FR]|uniref:ABC transporter ATP-binding protein n=1 Tax=Paenibacillus TaxID=44249 RepID=UPI000C27EDF7|nr:MULTISPECIES: ABC transporter ATP-binding protein [Paenibacillus]MEC0258185.1 ABC transporter ATP-binding protein [Paenibacillus lautus]PJN56816.1 Lipoprotein-releasing system ATP-binding protein LolD [Paenibacillus sp. GM2FR]